MNPCADGYAVRRYGYPIGDTSAHADPVDHHGDAHQHAKAAGDGHADPNAYSDGDAVTDDYAFSYPGSDAHRDRAGAGDHTGGYGGCDGHSNRDRAPDGNGEANRHPEAPCDAYSQAVTYTSTPSGAEPDAGRPHGWGLGNQTLGKRRRDCHQHRLLQCSGRPLQPADA